MVASSALNKLWAGELSQRYKTQFRGCINVPRLIEDFYKDTNMTLKVVPAGEADAPRFVALEQIAFGPNPMSSALYPGPFPQGNSHLEAKVINDLRASPHCRWMKVVDEDLEAKGEESTVASATWYFWDRPLTHEMLPPDGQYGPGANQEVCELFFGGMKRNMFKWFEGKPVARK